MKEIRFGMNRKEIVREIAIDAMETNNSDLIDEIAELFEKDNIDEPIIDSTFEKVEKYFNTVDRLKDEAMYNNSNWDKYIKRNEAILNKELKNVFPITLSISTYEESNSFQENLIILFMGDVLFNVCGYDTRSQIFRAYADMDNEETYEKIRKYIFGEDMISYKELKELLLPHNFVTKGFNGLPCGNGTILRHILIEMNAEYKKIMSILLACKLMEQEDIYPSNVVISKEERVLVINLLVSFATKIIKNLDSDKIEDISNMQADFSNFLSKTDEFIKEKKELEQEYSILKQKYNDKCEQYKILKENAEKNTETLEFTRQIGTLNKSIEQKDEDIKALQEIISNQEAEIERLMLASSKEDKISIEKMTIPSDLKILIAGGHYKTVAYIQELCPNSKAILSQTVPLSAAEAMTFDMVLYFNNFSNHCITERVKKYTDNGCVHIKQVYCYSKNIEIVKKVIYDAAKELGKID